MFYLQTSANPTKMAMNWYISHNVSGWTLSLTPSPYTVHSVMLPAQHPDLQTASVPRQHVTEDGLGAPVFVGGVESCHGVFCQGNLRQQHPCKPVSVDDLVHRKLDFQVRACWCQSCPWATTHQLDREDEAETEMNKGNLRGIHFH